ncbi:4733_t:CDS:2, partial [Scutellospora calospora]
QDKTQKVNIIDLIDLMDFADMDISENVFSSVESNLIEVANEIDEETDKTNEVDNETDDENSEIDEADEFETFIDKRLLIDIIEENPTNDEILEESSEFRGLDREYGPYFSNFTVAMLYIWSTKHTITTSAYKDLSKILIHPDFHTEDVVTNIQCIHKWRYRLPLVKVYQHDHILNNLTIMPKLYFRPGIVNEEKYEFWHSDLWQDSPLFGEHKIIQQTKRQLLEIQDQQSNMRKKQLAIMYEVTSFRPFKILK